MRSGRPRLPPRPVLALPRRCPPAPGPSSSGWPSSSVFAGFYLLNRPEKLPETTVEAAFTAASEHQLSRVTLEESTLFLEYVSGATARAELGRYDRRELQAYFAGQGVSVLWDSKREAGFPSSWLTFGAIGAVCFAGLFLWLRRSQGGMSNIWALRRTNAKLVDAPPQVTFADVGGNEEAKRRLRDVVGFLREPAKWQKTGARAPRGVLLEGPPGLGKTLLARALAGEAKVPLFTGSGSDFVELFVGVGAARVRDLFEVAQKKAPCIVFIDELDAVGRKRGAASSALMHQEREQALNQLLVCLDGFAPLSKVIVVAATNRADVLDPALLRPGRFDVRLAMEALTTPARQTVLEIHTRGKTLAPDVTLGTLAERTGGFSGADLEHLANEAALLAVRSGRDSITQADFEATLAARAQPIEFDKLDATLLEATAQLSRPNAPLRVTVKLEDGEFEGELLWVDPLSLKLKTAAGPLVISRHAIRSLAAHPGTPAATQDDLQRARAEVGTA